MVKAVWNGKVIAQSDSTEVVESNHYFPPGSVNFEYLKEASPTTECYWKGTANYYDVIVDGNTNREAAWVYKDPKPKAIQIKDYIAFWRGVKVITE